MDAVATQLEDASTLAEKASEVQRHASTAKKAWELTQEKLDEAANHAHFAACYEKLAVDAVEEALTTKSQEEYTVQLDYSITCRRQALAAAEKADKASIDANAAAMTARACIERAHVAGYEMEEALRASLLH